MPFYKGVKIGLNYRGNVDWKKHRYSNKSELLLQLANFFQDYHREYTCSDFRAQISRSSTRPLTLDLLLTFPTAAFEGNPTPSKQCSIKAGPKSSRGLSNLFKLSFGFALDMTSSHVSTSSARSSVRAFSMGYFSPTAIRWSSVSCRGRSRLRMTCSWSVSTMLPRS